MIAGRYVKSFADASHVCFEGHLDDPAFREIAIQRLRAIDAHSITVDSGTLKIEQTAKGERVRLEYRDAFSAMFGGGPTMTSGWPFKDDTTPAVQGSTP